MAPTIRFLFAVSIFLLLATCAQAQRITFHGAPTAQNSGNSSGNGNGFHHDHNSSAWGSDYASQPYYSSHHHHYEGATANSEYVIGYAHGDANFVPSVYMDYDKALALGRRILEEQSKPQPQAPPPSLGDVARALRQTKSDSPASASPSVSALQDNRGQLLICRVDVASC
jgi:hypothetical protein